MVDDIDVIQTFCNLEKLVIYDNDVNRQVIDSIKEQYPKIEVVYIDPYS